MPSTNRGRRSDVAVSVDLSSALLAQLDEAAARQGLSRAEFIRQAVEQALEDAEDAAVSIARLQDAADPLVPWDEVKRAAGL